MNHQVELRSRAARRIAEAYGSAPNLSMVAVAGSVGAGLADRWSDLEIDCYWYESPTTEERLAPIKHLGAELTTLWDYDEDDQEWSEDYRFDGLPVTVSNFRVNTVDAFLDAVLIEGNLDTVKHFRLAALRSSYALRGSQMLAEWRQRAAVFPDRLVHSLVERSLTPGQFPGWRHREVLVARGDAIAVRSLLAAVGEGVFDAVLAINRIYRSHRLVKWQHSLFDQCRLLPPEFAPRLEGLWHHDLEVALTHAEALLLTTLDLAENEFGTSLANVRNDLIRKRDT
ncbi:hypothetical protein [Nesterenkonia muleiensis]|uniref:hypothetical protein n=1 Tax=Nesterenkonia muleiensis TaxID=2282648 RepID=UPI0013004585|nr:hypothetical protein [Nesterenkonia muleiensis]